MLLKVLRLLAAGALRQDFWSFLQLDRKERQLMKFPNDFDNLSVEEQKAVAMFLCNSFSSCKVALSPEWSRNHQEISFFRPLTGFSTGPHGS